MPGMHQRFKLELKRFKTKLPCLEFANVVSSVVPPSILSWMGGSVIGSLPILKEVSITARAWQDNAHVLDDASSISSRLHDT